MSTSAPESSLRSDIRTLWATNGLIALLITVLSITWLWLEYGPERAGPVEPFNAQPFIDEAQAKLEKHKEDIAKELGDLLAEITPEVTSAVANQATEDVGTYIATLKTQSNELLDHLQAAFATRLEKRWEPFVDRLEVVLAEELGRDTDEDIIENLARRLTRSLRKQVERYHMLSLNELARETGRAWAMVEPLPEPPPGDPPLTEQLMQYASDWTVLTLTDRVEDKLRQTELGEEDNR